MRKSISISISTLLILHLGCDKPAQVPSPTNAISTSVQANQPSSSNSSAPSEIKLEKFDGFSIPIPQGWQTTPPQRGKTKAHLIKLDSSGKEVTSMIMIDAGTPTSPDSKSLAEGLAKEFGGSVDALPVQLDGQEGYRFTSPSQTFDQPSVGIAVLKPPRAYMLMGASNNQAEVAAAISEIQKNWKWID